MMRPDRPPQAPAEDEQRRGTEGSEKRSAARNDIAPLYCPVPSTPAAGPGRPYARFGHRRLVYAAKTGLEEPKVMLWDEIGPLFSPGPRHPNYA